MAIKYLNISWLYWLLLLICMGSCAKIVAPVGGPKDTQPPVIVKETPANGSPQFHGNTIKITFNEFVTLDNTFENVLISPPLAQQPTYSLSGKTLTIKMLDTLKANQTYNIGFINCIKDFTEGNPIPFYNYALSTGAAVDSFLVNGKIIDAKTNNPVKDCFVFAYSQDIDSLPLTTRPDYITKTQKDGTFSITNIKSGNYKLFALQDINNNLIFDLPNEEIAFYNELVAAKKMPLTIDSLSSDSSHIQRDTTELHSIKNTILYFFMEEDSTQSFVKVQNKEVGKYEFIYKTAVLDFQATIRYPDSVDYFETIGTDTVTWFFKQPITDSVVVVLTANDTVCDTLKLEPYKQTDRRGSGRRGAEKKEPTLAVTAAHAGEFYTPLSLHFPYPIQPTDSVPIQIVASKKYAGNDTLLLLLSIPDTFCTKLTINQQFEEKVPYTITIRDSVFFGYNGLTNDSVNIQFTTKTEKDYGLLRMKYTLPENSYPFVIQLLDNKDGLIQTNIIQQTTTIAYPELLAGKYKVKAIEDRNGNGVWDTGNYHQKIYPERIFFFPRDINVRGYWELEEEFTLNKE